MVFGEGRRVIWLDEVMGVQNHYLQFKANFNASMQPMTSMPPNNLNELIQCFEDNVCPISFVANVDDALHLIQANQEKTLIWISSATAGRPIVPILVRDYSHIKSYYFFCANIRYHVGWALEHDLMSILLMFDHETDLLVRLLRDTSSDAIDLGKAYLQVNDGESARKCFVVARTLEISANENNTGHAPFTKRLQLLDGPNGLIEQAEQMRNANR